MHPDLHGRMWLVHHRHDQARAGLTTHLERAGIKAWCLIHVLQQAAYKRAQQVYTCCLQIQ
jgi:hypothetical protein